MIPKLHSTAHSTLDAPVQEKRKAAAEDDDEDEAGTWTSIDESSSLPYAHLKHSSIYSTLSTSLWTPSLQSTATLSVYRLTLFLPDTKPAPARKRQRKTAADSKSAKKAVNNIKKEEATIKNDNDAADAV